VEPSRNWLKAVPYDRAGVGAGSNYGTANVASRRYYDRQSSHRATASLLLTPARTNDGASGRGVPLRERLLL
jgi:hypothetical protein